MSDRIITTYKQPSFDGSSDQAQFMTQGEQVTLKKTSYKEGYEQGYKDGEKFGRANALQEHDHHVTQVMEQMLIIVQELSKKNTDYEAQLIQHINYSLALIIKKLFPFYLKREGKIELREFVKNTVYSLLDKEGTKVFVHTSMLNHIKEYLDKQPEKSHGIQILEDGSLNEYACTIKWKCGGGLYDLNSLYGRIDEILSNNISISAEEKDPPKIAPDIIMKESNNMEVEHV
jgi:flagellar biosynthesis/type III secretory pathway protein FliH